MRAETKIKHEFSQCGCRKGGGDGGGRKSILGRGNSKCRAQGRAFLVS